MIDLSKYDAIIFDLDGTLADTMPLHYEACNAVCEKRGFSFPLDFFYAEAGKPTTEVFLNLMKLKKLSFDGFVLGEEKERKVLDLMHKVTFVNPVKEIFDFYKGKMKFAIGSGGQRITVDLTLKNLDISNDFQAIVTCDDVSKHKPNPETFLKASELMEVKPEKCIVFEDGDPGIEAAIKANMDYLDIRTLLK